MIKKMKPNSLLGCVCFGWKSLPEMLFRKWGCLVGSENSIFRKLKSVVRKKMPLTTEIILHFYFPFKVFPKNFTERERAHARARREETFHWGQRSPENSELQSAPIAISPANIPVAVDRNLAVARSRCWSRSREASIVYIGERGRSEIAIDASRDRAVDRDLGSRLTVRSSDWICRRTGSGLWLVFFWICVFLLLFQTPENIFRKIFWNATKHMETFSFSGN